MGILLLAASLFCAIYAATIINYNGYDTAFLIFWPIASVAFFLLFVGRHKKWTNRKLSKKVLVPAYTLTVTGVLIFVIVALKVVAGMGATYTKDADYVIVLGCQIRGEEPSPVLKDRLDTALEYLEEHPTTMVIVSGGMDEKYERTEASVMAEYLEEQGLNKMRILLENRAENTTQNLLYSKDKIEEGADIVIVTSNYHVTRASYLAGALGYRKTGMMAAPSDPVLLLNYTVRECAAILYEKLIGII